MASIRARGFFDAIRQDPVLSPAEADFRALGYRARAATSSATIRRASPNGTTASATRLRRFWRGDAGQRAGAGGAPDGLGRLFDKRRRKPGPRQFRRQP